MIDERLYYRQYVENKFILTYIWQTTSLRAALESVVAVTVLSTFLCAQSIAADGVEIQLFENLVNSAHGERTVLIAQIHLVTVVTCTLHRAVLMVGVYTVVHRR